MHLFNAETFSQKMSRRLPNCQENVCIACQENGLYAVGCRSYTLLLDPRTLQAVKKIASRYNGCGIRSASFQQNILTIGTGLGMLMFYDVRAGKYLESSINTSRTVVLKASKGYVVSFWWDLGNFIELVTCFKITNHFIIFSSPTKMLITYRMWNMSQQFIRTAMIKATRDYSPPVDPYQRHLLEIIVAFGSELILSFYVL